MPIKKYNKGRFAEIVHFNFKQLVVETSEGKLNRYESNQMTCNKNKKFCLLKDKQREMKYVERERERERERYRSN